MYKIIGGDGREYGPVSADQLIQWIREGRAQAETQAAGDDGAWRPLSSFAEFSPYLRAPVPPANDPAAAPQSPGAAASATSGTGSAATGAPPSPPAPPPHVSNLLVPAIFTTLCCCFPAGVVAIVFAAQANAARNAGDWPRARSAAGNATIWCWVAFGLGIVSNALMFVFWSARFR